MTNYLTRVYSHKYILIALCIALIVRLFFSALPPFKSDMDSFIAWGEHVYSVGFANFYSSGMWTDYAPGYFYFLWVLTFVKNVFFSSISREGYEILHKSTSIVSDLVTGALLYATVLHSGMLSRRVRMLVGVVLASVYMLSPFTFINGAIWGQVDSVFTVFLALSLYFLITQKTTMAAAAYVCACVIKPQAAIVAPAYLAFFLLLRPWSRFYYATLTGVLVFFLLTSPFFGISSIQSLYQLMQSSIETYPYGSINTFNLWGMYGFWKPDTLPFLWGLTQQQFGSLSFLSVAVAGFAYFVYIMRGQPYLKRVMFFSFYAGMLILCGVLLLTRMHERYVFPAFYYILTSFGLSLLFIRSAKAHMQPFFSRVYLPGSLMLYFTLVLIHCVNLYYVYMYYYYFLYFKLEVPAENTFFYSIAGSIPFWSLLQVISSLFYVFLVVYTVFLLRKVRDGHVTT